MKNKKGFTLIELVAVAVLLCVIVVLVTPNMIKMSKERKKELYQSKIQYIESNATSWGNKNIDSLSENCTCITVGELVRKAVLTGDDKEKTTIYDPRYNSSMNDLNVCVTYNAAEDRTYAHLFEQGEDDSACY